MNAFSAELSALIKAEFGGSQLELSRQSGVSQSMISRQCSGRSLPDRKTLHRLLSAVSRPQAIALVTAYLREVCPPDFRGAVEIEPRAQSLRDAVDWRGPSLGMLVGHDRAAVERLCLAASGDRRIGRLLEALAEVLAERPPTVSGLRRKAKPAP